MREWKVQPEAWAPFAEGLKGMFTEPILQEIARKHEKTPAQVILRWNVQQGVVVIPKSIHRDRMEENLAIWDFVLDPEEMVVEAFVSIFTRPIWDFVLDPEEMEQIAALDQGCPSMLDTRKTSEVKRVYDYLNHPVLTSL